MCHLRSMWFHLGRGQNSPVLSHSVHLERKLCAGALEWEARVPWAGVSQSTREQAIGTLGGDRSLSSLSPLPGSESADVSRKQLLFHSVCPKLKGSKRAWLLSFGIRHLIWSLKQLESSYSYFLFRDKNIQGQWLLSLLSLATCLGS